MYLKYFEEKENTLPDWGVHANCVFCPVSLNIGTRVEGVSR